MSAVQEPAELAEDGLNESIEHEEGGGDEVNLADSSPVNGADDEPFRVSSVSSIDLEWLAGRYSSMFDGIKVHDDGDGVDSLYEDDDCKGGGVQFENGDEFDIPAVQKQRMKNLSVDIEEVNRLAAVIEEENCEGDEEGRFQAVEYETVSDCSSNDSVKVKRAVLPQFTSVEVQQREDPEDGDDDDEKDSFMDINASPRPQGIFHRRYSNGGIRYLRVTRPKIDLSFVYFLYFIRKRLS